MIEWSKYYVHVVRVLNMVSVCLPQPRPCLYSLPQFRSLFSASETDSNSVSVPFSILCLCSSRYSLPLLWFLLSASAPVSIFSLCSGFYSLPLSTLSLCFSLSSRPLAPHLQVARPHTLCRTSLRPCWELCLCLGSHPGNTQGAGCCKPGSGPLLWGDHWACVVSWLHTDQFREVEEACKKKSPLLCANVVCVSKAWNLRLVW